MNMYRKTIFLLYVVTLFLTFSPAQGVVISKECSPSWIQGYAKYMAGSFFVLMGVRQLIVDIRDASQRSGSGEAFGGFVGVVVGVAIDYQIAKMIFDSAHDNFEAIAQEERDKLAQVFVAAQQQAQQHVY